MRLNFARYVHRWTTSREQFHWLEHLNELRTAQFMSLTAATSHRQRIFAERGNADINLVSNDNLNSK
jgi:hypothetical protein